MILPTPEFDPLFANDGIPFRTKMLDYIEREFADLLGDQRRLLCSESGLDWLADRLKRESPEGRVEKAA